MKKSAEDIPNLKGSHVVVLGLARQGTALARFLVQEGASVIVSDLRKEPDLVDEMASLEGLPIEYVLGRHPKRILNDADLVYLSGGVPLESPIVVEAQKRGIPLSNDAQLFIERCPAPVIGITGSAGKTTTTALVGEMCKAAGFTTWVGGNIGNPLIADLDKILPEDKVVMELSSFQLEIMTVSPHIAAVLNVTPNHLDRHKTMEAYIAAKRNIIAHQTEQDYAVLGFDDARARGLALETAAQLVFFSGGAEVEPGAWKTNGEMNLRFEGADTLICRSKEVRLRGDHNILNVLAASAVCSVAGVSVEAIRGAIDTFTGVEHRMELVREVRGARYYDDSIATAPERVVAALRSYQEPMVLLAGGRDKDLPWESFAAEAVARVRHLITFGEAGPMIARTVEARRAETSGKLEGIAQVETLEEAVTSAASVARPGDVVLLSPGGTSFDAFRDFAERGDRFKELVDALEE
jgi:UDP-N-acetylmuramoylalanine--D-glutamate ligase